MLMPIPDGKILARRTEIIQAMRGLLPADSVITEHEDLAVYAFDGLTAFQARPLAVVLPRTIEEVSAILRWCHEHGVKVVARGAGTSLAGGTLPLEDGIVLGMARFRNILSIDYDNRWAVVQPGVPNLQISVALAERGFYYAPDPSSQITCTIGGNVGTNAGGLHCLKYGVTTNNILGVQMVLMDGTVIRAGGQALDSAGYDLLGLICGSEGLLGVITEITVRIQPKPENQRALLIGFPTVVQAGECVAAIIGAGIIPAGMEIMDKSATWAAEQHVHAGYPLDVEALMIVEFDGPLVEVDHLIEKVDGIAKAAGAVSTRASTSEEERQRFWAGRKAAFPAVGRISPDYYCMDGTIPRRTLGQVLIRINEIAASYGLRVCNVFHAGDGNLHPMLLYNANKPGEAEAAEQAGGEILTTCVEVGGVLTGEHGVGVEKRDLMHHQFGPIDLEQQTKLKCAFDELGLLNPGKMFPELFRCGEGGKPHVEQHAKVRAERDQQLAQNG